MLSGPTLPPWAAALSYRRRIQYARYQAMELWRSRRQGMVYAQYPRPAAYVEIQGGPISDQSIKLELRPGEKRIT